MKEGSAAVVPVVIDVVVTGVEVTDLAEILRVSEVGLASKAALTSDVFCLVDESATVPACGGFLVSLSLESTLFSLLEGLGVSCLGLDV